MLNPILEIYIFWVMWFFQISKHVGDLQKAVRYTYVYIMGCSMNRKNSPDWVFQGRLGIVQNPKISFPEILVG